MYYSSSTDKYFVKSGDVYYTMGTELDSRGQYVLTTATDVPSDVTAVDFRTAENYSTYLNAGLNVLLLQANESYNGTNYDSTLGKYATEAVKAGITKIIVFDSRIQKLSASKTAIVGTGAQFATVDELNTYVANCLNDYKSKSWFYGVMLVDEPNWQTLPNLGLVYKAIKKACPSAYVQTNLLPLSAGQNTNYVPTEDNDTYQTYKTYVQTYFGYTASLYADSDMYEAYKQYLTAFATFASPDRICFDSYPIRADQPNYLLSTHFAGLQIAANVAKQFNIEIAGVIGAAGTVDSTGTAKHKAPTEEELLWQFNAYMMFGCKSFAYFTYQTKQNVTDGSLYYVDGTSAVNRLGQTTETYDAITKINTNMQAFAPTMLDYDYVGMQTIVKKGLTATAPTVFNGTSNDTFSCVSSLEITDTTTLKEVRTAAVTELYNEQTKTYMYAVLNANEPSANDLDETVKLTLNGSFTYAEVWTNGTKQVVEITNGTVSVTVSAGTASYIILH